MFFHEGDANGCINKEDSFCCVYKSYKTGEGVQTEGDSEAGYLARPGPLRWHITDWQP